MATERDPFSPDIAHVREALREHDENIDRAAPHPEREQRSSDAERPTPIPDDES
jgi:hypothetical protein